LVDLYEQCGNVVGLAVGSFTLVKDEGDAKRSLTTQEDVRIALADSGQTEKFIVDEKPFSPPMQCFDQKYDVDSGGSFGPTEQSAGQATAELTVPKPFASQTFKPLQSQTIVSPGTLSEPFGTELPNSLVMSYDFRNSDPLPSLAAIPSQPSIETVLSRLSNDISDLIQVAKTSQEGKVETLTACASLSSAVDALRDSLVSLKRDLCVSLVDSVRDSVRAQIREELMGSILSAMKSEIRSSVADMSGEIRKLVNPSIESKQEGSNEEDLVRLQSSTCLPEHEALLKQLEAVGFTNRTFNLVLLDLHGGDMTKVTADLKKYYKIERD